MNFTREPIILSVLTPKEGSKLVVRKSKGKGEEEDYFVDAIEIVSFEGAVFFRSTERPKSFLVPVSDYEVLELKETKIVLKNVSIDKNIKIPSKHSGQPRKESSIDKKQHRRRRPRTEGSPAQQQPSNKEVKKESGRKTVSEEAPQPSLKRLIPPPHTLIKEKLARFKNEEFFEKNILPSTEGGADATEEKPAVPSKVEKPKEERQPEKKAQTENASEKVEKPAETKPVSSKEKEKGVDS